MNFYVRHKEGVWITFVHNVQELRELCEAYIPGRPITIGDVSTFNTTMMNMLLKFVEENPVINLYSSKDITDPVILSRFVDIVKDPISVQSLHSLEEFVQSDKSYLSAYMYLGSAKPEVQLRAPICNHQLLKLLLL